MRAIAVVLSLAAVGFAGEARAQSQDTGLTLGARLGYGFPMGDAAKPGGQSWAMTKVMSGQIPAEIEAGYRFTKEISAGAFFGYGYGFAAKGLCDEVGPLPAGVTCSTSGAYVMRYGIQAAYRFLGSDKVPWIGIGAGVEKAKIDIKVEGFGQSQSVKFEVSGWEYFNVQGGVDWTVSKGFLLGPFARLSIAKYDTVKVDGQKQDFPSSDRTYHEWITIGVKGTFDL